MSHTKILRPFELIVKTSTWGATANNFVTATDPGDDLSHDDDTTRAFIGSGGNFAQIGFRTDPTFNERMVAIEKTSLWTRAKRTSSSTNNFTLRIYLGGNIVESSAINFAAEGTYGSHEYDVTSLRPGGGLWSEADFRDVSLVFAFVGSLSNPAMRVTSIWMEIGFVASGAKIEASRRIGSRRLRLLSKPMSLVEIDVTDTKYLNRKIGDVIGLSHFAVPHASNTGAAVGIKPWERIPYILMGRELNPDTMTTRLTLLDGRNYWLGLWDVAKSELSGTSQRDGIATLDAGAERTFLRNSSAWFADPGDGRIIQAASHEEKNTESGHLLEGAAINEVLGTNFSEGYAARWGTQGVAGGATVADDTTDLLWDTDETTNSVILTAADPLGGTELAITQTTALYAADSVITISASHKDDSGYPSAILAQRSDDNEYWNAATPDWQAGAVWNDLTVRSTKERDQLSNIDIGGAASTILIKVAAENTAGQVNHIYDVQCEETPYATSRIMTTSAAVTREADNFHYSNTVSARTFGPSRGSAFVRFIPEWSTAELAASDKKTIFYAAYTASYIDHVYYDQATSAWVFVRTVNGVAYTATKSATVTKGTTYDIAMRWTSNENEHDLIPAGVDGRKLDGAADHYIKNADLDGNADSKEFIFSCWLTLHGGDGTLVRILANQDNWFELHRATDNTIVFQLWETTPVQRCVYLISSNTFVAGPSPIHILASANAASDAWLRINGAIDEGTNTVIDDVGDFTRVGWVMGRNYASAVSYLPATASELYFQPGESLDFDVEANYRKYIDANLNPVDLGSDGSTPTGTSPLIYTPDGNLAFNRGTGGVFPEAGAPTADDGPAVSNISIFIDGTKGTDARCPAPSTEASTLQIGRESANSNMLDGWLQHIYTTPLVLTDEAIARLP